MTNSESPLIKTFFAPKFSNVSKPTIKASYYASLLEHTRWILKKILKGLLLGDIKTIIIPAPFTCFDPSKYNIKVLIPI